MKETSTQLGFHLSELPVRQRISKKTRLVITALSELPVRQRIA